MATGDEMISVVIVTWNAQAYIAACLDAVCAQAGVVCEIIVVDNGSTDATRDILSSYAARIIRIDNRGNAGFCHANNQGIRISRGAYVCTLNSDVILAPDYLRFLKAFLDRHPAVGMVQGKYLRDDRQTVDCTGLLFSASGRLYNRDEGRRDGPRMSRTRAIFGPCAAAALYRRTVMEQIRWGEEYFDERFFFLVEDFDIAWRARRCGWQACFVPEAVCVHRRNSSSHPSAKRQYLSFRNRYYLLLKNAGAKELLLFCVFFLVYDVPRVLVMLLRNPLARQAFRDITAYAPEMLHKRRALDRSTRRGKGKE